MSRIKRIILTTDLSTAAETAFRYADLLARRFGAQLDLVHVLTPAFPGPTGEAEEAQEPDPGAASSRARERLEAASSTCFRSTEVYTEVIEHRCPHEAIVRSAEETLSDLIVLAARGQSPCRTIPLGSVAERVAQYSKTPILVVRAPSEPTGRDPRVHRILCPTDLSGRSLDSVFAGSVLAQKLDAEVHLLHVTSDDAGTNPEHPEHDDVRRAFRDFVSGKVPRDSPRHLRSGKPSRRILEFAEKAGTDLIVLASHGHDAYHRYLLGGTAERVLRYAACSVMVVPVRPGTDNRRWEPGEEEDDGDTQASDEGPDEES